MDAARTRLVTGPRRRLGAAAGALLLAAGSLGVSLALQRPATVLKAITEREREVLTLIGLGLSNTEIASQLHVSLSTAKTHVGRLLMKLDARDRAQLVIAAYDTGLVSPPQGS